MTTCECCAKAELAPATHLIHAGCCDCEARALAHMPHMADVALADAMVPAYRDALQAVAGDEWEALHQRVKYWAKKLEAAK